MCLSTGEVETVRRLLLRGNSVYVHGATRFLLRRALLNPQSIRTIQMIHPRRTSRPWMVHGLSTHQQCDTLTVDDLNWLRMTVTPIHYQWKQCPRSMDSGFHIILDLAIFSCHQDTEHSAYLWGISSGPYSFGHFEISAGFTVFFHPSTPGHYYSDRRGCLVLRCGFWPPNHAQGGRSRGGRRHAPS